MEKLLKIKPDDSKNFFLYTYIAIVSLNHTILLIYFCFIDCNFIIKSLSGILLLYVLSLKCALN